MNHSGSGALDVRYSNIQYGFSGEGNISADPLFVDVGVGDVHLLAGSPAIDSGSNALSAEVEYDMDHRARTIFTVDMGADEFWPYPDAVDDAFTTSEDTAAVFDVLANDTDPDGNLDPTTLKLTSEPTHGSVTIDGASGAITYLPERDWFGVEGFAYEVCDTTDLCDVALVGITVDPVNDVPVAVDDVYATPYDLIVSAPRGARQRQRHRRGRVDGSARCRPQPRDTDSQRGWFVHLCSRSGIHWLRFVHLQGQRLEGRFQHRGTVTITVNPALLERWATASTRLSIRAHRCLGSRLAGSATAAEFESCASSHLVTVTSQEEQDALYGFFGLELHDKWFGGFQDAGVVPADAGWKWITGEPWSYTNWRAGEPNDDSGTASEQYLIGLNDGTWNDTQFILGWTKGYVVEYEGVITYFAGHYYDVVSEPLDWSGAMAAADASVLEGCSYAHLATITSQEEQDAIHEGLGNDIAFSWLGAHQDEEGAWQWVTDEPWGYTNWQPGEPRRLAGRECASRRRWRSRLPKGWIYDGRWNDMFDSSLYPHIVEYEGCTTP